MSILLTHTYYIYEDVKEQSIMKPYAPLGLLYISAYLNENNVKNFLYDSTFYSREAQLTFIKEKQPKVVAIYTNLMTKINVIKLIKTLKTDNLYGFPKIILGGPDITYNCENYLNTGADFLIIGEGEQTTLELYDAILKKEDYSKVTGIAYKENGSVIKTPPRLKMKDLSELPLPNRTAIPVEKYLDTWKTNHGMSSMTVSTQRGCPYTCKWCSTAVYGQSYRRRSPENVVAELKEIQEKYNPDTIWFVDDVFTVSHKWLDAFADELESQNVQVKFECISRADRMNQKVIATLKRAGCFRVWIGAESGSQKIIDAMDRRVSVHQVREMIQETRKVGIEAGTFIMLGYPGETKEDIKETIHHLKVSNPDHFTITVAYPIKGTSLYNEIEDRQTKVLDWSKSTDRDRDFKRTYPKKYYEYAVSWVVNEVNYHKKLQDGKINKELLAFKMRSILSYVKGSIYKKFVNG